jgi:ubiquitin carboxyl-terminal hydrolase 34
VLTDRHGIPAKIRSEPKTLIDAIIQSENEYLIGGCSQLLLKIESSYDLIDDKLLEALWEGCLFGANAKCKAAETRESIYELILKVVDKRKELTCQLWKLTTQTLKKVLDKSKLVNPNDLQSRSPYGYVGLKNIGNICYMLAMLQQFFHNPTFRHLLLRIDDGKPSNTVTIPSTPNSAERQVDDNMLHQLRKMFGYLQSTTRLDFAPHDFCYSFKGFSGEPVNVGVQQDAQEFVSMIFDKLEDAIKGTPFKRVIDSIYRGKLTNTLTCSKCKKAKHREEIFYSLQVDIKNSKTLPDSLKKVCQG